MRCTRLSDVGFYRLALPGIDISVYAGLQTKFAGRLHDTRASQLRLQTTVRLRWFAVLGQLLAIGVIVGIYGFEVPLGPCLTLIALSAWLNVFLSITFSQRHRLGTLFGTVLLGYDILQLAALLYFTGGIENPFAVLLVAPVTVSAGTLPVRAVLFLGALTIVAATFLVNEHFPLPWYQGFRFELPRDYRHGFLAALVACAVFLALYTWRLTKESQQMAAALAATDLVLANEQRLHALDGLAAAAAHELGTPLSTIAVVSKELERELGGNERYAEDLALLRSQAQRCREILQKLTKRPDEQDPLHARLSIREFLEEAAAPYRAKAKAVVIAAKGAGTTEPIGQRLPGVIYGFGNLIENAVDFARSRVDIEAIWSAGDVTVTVADDGPGFPIELMDSLGEPYVTTRASEIPDENKRGGLGLGFFIARTLLERSGATVTLSNRPEPLTGAVVTIVWPRSAFEDSAAGRVPPFG